MTVQALRSAPLYNSLALTKPTAPPVMFEPPAALTGGRHEVWVAAGGPEGWGGCHIWGSIDDASYDHFGAILRSAVVGMLAAPLSSAADPDVTSTMHVDVSWTNGTIHPGSDHHANMFVTLCWVGGELVSYTAATLIAQHQYKMGRRLRRGAFGTPVGDHPAGTLFAKIDRSIFKVPYPAHWVGATVYAKFPAFNEHGLQQQELDVVPSYSVILTGVSGK